MRDFIKACAAFAHDEPFIALAGCFCFIAVMAFLFSA